MKKFRPDNKWFDPSIIIFQIIKETLGTATGKYF